MQGLQQLPGILEIASPEQTRAFADQAVGAVSAQTVVSEQHTAGGTGAIFTAPQGLVRLAMFFPVKQGGGRGGGGGTGDHAA